MNGEAAAGDRRVGRVGAARGETGFEVALSPGNYGVTLKSLGAEG